MRLTACGQTTRRLPHPCGSYGGITGCVTHTSRCQNAKSAAAHCSSCNDHGRGSTCGNKDAVFASTAKFHQISRAQGQPPSSKAIVAHCSVFGVADGHGFDVRSAVLPRFCHAHRTSWQGGGVAAAIAAEAPFAVREALGCLVQSRDSGCPQKAIQVETGLGHNVKLKDVDVESALVSAVHAIERRVNADHATGA